MEKLERCAWLVDHKCKGLAEGVASSEYPAQGDTAEVRVLSMMRIMHFKHSSSVLR